VDLHGHLWTPFGHLRIRRLGVRVAAGARHETPAQVEVSACRAVAALPEAVPREHSREPSTVPSGHQRADVVGDMVAVSLGYPFSTDQKVGGSSSSGGAVKDLVEAGLCLLRGVVAAPNG